MKTRVAIIAVLALSGFVTAQANPNNVTIDRENLPYPNLEDKAVLDQAFHGAVVAQKSASAVAMPSFSQKRGELVGRLVSKVLFVNDLMEQRANFKNQQWDARESESARNNAGVVSLVFGFLGGGLFSLAGLTSGAVLLSAISGLAGLALVGLGVGLGLWARQAGKKAKSFDYPLQNNEDRIDRTQEEIQQIRVELSKT